MAEQDQEMEYFKEKLYSNFKEAGLLDHLKSQMRYNILEKLQKRNLSKEANKENINILNQKKENPLNFRLFISIISEFLEYYGYNYTQAVFLPEAKHTNQTLSRNEIIEILNLTKIANKEDSSPLLNRIIDYVDRQMDLSKDKTSIQCQTDFEGRNTNLEDKLRNIDYEYLQKIDGERIASQQSFDEKFTKFKKDYEQRMKAEMTAEITRIREFELANIRLDEAEKYRLKMEQYRNELDQVYTEKLQKLREREKDTIERCKQQLKALETASFDHRQKFLKDLEMHKMKEEGLDQHLNLEKENIRLQKQRLQELERDLQRQSQELEDQKKTLSRQKHNEDTVKATSFKVEPSREAEEDRIALLQTKARLETETHKVEQFKSAVENYESQNKRLLEENQQIMEEVRRLREIKKNHELELEKNKETLDVMKKSLNKDEEHIKLYDKQIQGYQDEIKSHKTAVAEYKDMLQQRKREQIEANQKFIKEIEFYQNEIEKLERERDTLRRRTQDLEVEINTLGQTQVQVSPQFHTQTVEMGIQKDSFRTSNRMAPDQKRDSYRMSNNYMPESVNRYRFTNTIAEENEGPLRRLEDIDREIRELKDKRENDILGYTASAEKKPIKVRSPSPPAERERYTLREEEIQQSPQFRTYIDQSGTNLLDLEKKKQDLKYELKHMIGLDDSSRNDYSRQADESFAGAKGSEFKREVPRDSINFENIFDKYADKMLEDSNRFDSPNETPYQKRDKLISEMGLKLEDMEPSGKKTETTKKAREQAPKGNEGSSRVQDIFKVHSSKPMSEPKYEAKNQFDVLEDLSQRSHKSLLDSFTEDNPQPIIFTKKETAPKKEPEKITSSETKLTNKPSQDVKPQAQPKKVEKLEPANELPTSIGNKNLSRLDKPKLGDINPSQTKIAEKSAAPLVLPDFGAKSKPKEEPKRTEPRANAAIDAILGDQRKVTDEIDFEEIDEELFDL